MNHVEQQTHIKNMTQPVKQCHVPQTKLQQILNCSPYLVFPRSSRVPLASNTLSSLPFLTTTATLLLNLTVLSSLSALSLGVKRLGLPLTHNVQPLKIGQSVLISSPYMLLQVCPKTAQNLASHTLKSDPRNLHQYPSNTTLKH